MNNAFRSVALIGKYRSREIAASLLELARFLSQRGVEVFMADGIVGLANQR